MFVISMEKFMRSIKRLFGALLLAIIFTFFIFLLWQDAITATISNYSRIMFLPRTFKNHEWTWQCAENECKKSKPVNSTMMSWLTCNMICGSVKIWPMPTKQMSLSNNFVMFNPRENVRMIINKSQYVTKDVISYLNDVWLIFKSKLNVKTSRKFNDGYFSNFNSNIKNMCIKKRSSVKNVSKFLINIEVRTNKLQLELKTNEQYLLQLKTHANYDQIEVNVTAETVFGARHALETLGQLIWTDIYCAEGYVYVLKTVKILDEPKFAYRGLMLDTARNYFSPAAIKRTLDGMAFNKMNVFHWHISDSQSFPLYLMNEPRLAKYGAYGPDFIYTEDDVIEINNYAHRRGVRILIEVDAPAHAGHGWEWGPESNLGDLAVCIDQEPWMNYCGEPPCGQINPFNNHVFNVLETIYRDVIRLTNESEMYHLGGDEVNFNCWESYQKKNMKFETYETDFYKIWSNFYQKQVEALKKANNNKLPKYIIVWSSDLTKAQFLKETFDVKNTVVQCWGSSDWLETSEILSAGFKVILSHVDSWYLDCGFGNWKRTGEATCPPYKTWQTVYQHRPWGSGNLNMSLILGAEVCLWTEQVDEFSLDARLWPRTSAFAERLWSDLDTASYLVPEDVFLRFQLQRDRLVQLGLRAEMIHPMWCEQNPKKCL